MTRDRSVESPYHDWEPFCVEPLTPVLDEMVTLRLRTAATSGWLIYDRYGELTRLELQPLQGGLEASLTMYASPLRYVFFVEGRYVSSDGIEATLPRFDHFFHLLSEPSVPDWVVGAIFYQIFPDRFKNGRPELPAKQLEWTYEGQPVVKKAWGRPPDPRGGAGQFYGGDLAGVAESLDYLVELGIEALYLTPIFKSSSSHRYDTEDYLQVDPRLGGEQAFQTLLTELQQRGLRLVLDGVFNHTSNHYPDFEYALAHPGSPAAGMYTFYASGGYASFSPTMPKVNYASPLAKERLIWGADAPVRHWIRKGADGWRIDVANQVGESGTDRNNNALLRQIHRTARQENPQAFVFGELSFDTIPYLRGHTLDGSMHYAGFAHPIMEWLSGKNIRGEAVVVGPRDAWMALWDHYQALPLQLRQSMYTLLGSHDVPRPLWRLRGDVRKFMLAYGILLTFPGAPGIYYGDEIGLSQANAFEDWCGDPMCRGTFPWTQESWNREVRDWLRKLIGLRKRTVELRRGGLRSLAAPEGVLAYKRVYQGSEVWVFGALEPVELCLPPSRDLLNDREVSGRVTLSGLGVFAPLGGIR